jgi:hypothetical protein
MQNQRRFNPGILFASAALLLSGCEAPPLELSTVSPPRAALKPAEQSGSVPPEVRITDYLLDAELDAENHRIAGTARVWWRNTTQGSVETLPFHLYMNGFRAENTEWMQSSRGRHRRSEQQEEGAWGYIDIHSVELVPGRPLLSDAIEPTPSPNIPLDWQEEETPSTMVVQLPQPVGPGESIVVDLEFTTQLPLVLARTGYKDDFHAVGQWYPKLGVLEDDGRWENHTFTVQDEFYADFGNYVAHLNVPEDMVVGATGIRTSERVSEGRKHLTYEAQMVHDFAWMADPKFVEQSVNYRGIYIRQLIQPDRTAEAEIHMATQIAAIDSYEERFGPYPWSTLTIVHPPEGAEGAGGMEYQTLFTTSNYAPLPGWVRAYILDERVSGSRTTLHEFGHQYFQGLLASREHQQPWLDEGVNTFSNYLANGDRYSPDAWVVNLLGNKMYQEDTLRLFSLSQGSIDAIDQPARAFDSLVGSYRAVYMKTAAMLATLRNVVGEEAFDRAFRVYCDRSRFRHPTGHDLETTLIEELGKRVNLAPEGQPPAYLDIPAFLEQGLRTTYQIDFSIKSIRNLRRMGKAGWHRDAEGDLVGGEPPENADQDVDSLDDDQLTGLVVLHRKGAFKLPVDLLVEFADGSTESLVWDGQKTTKVLTWPGRRIKKASLDPEGKFLLEGNRANNNAYVKGEGDDGLSGRVGTLVEGLSLAALGGLTP